MDLTRKALDVFLHLDRHLNTVAGDLRGWLYGLPFLIVFSETGLVVTSFLPGDSLVFAVGALATRPGSPINLPLAGYVFADLPVVREQFHYIILAISAISVLQLGIEYLRARREAAHGGPAAAVAGENTVE